MRRVWIRRLLRLSSVENNELARGSLCITTGCDNEMEHGLLNELPKNIYKVKDSKRADSVDPEEYCRPSRMLTNAN